MHYAAIAPTAALSLLAGRPVQMCLAPQVLRDDKYAAFYNAQATTEGHTVIMDNGAWEGNLLRFRDYLAAITMVRPQVVVLPDVPNDARATQYLGACFMDYWDSIFDRINWPVQLMYVPQAPESEDRVWEYCEQYTQCTTPWIGFTRHMGTRRVEVVKRLKQLRLWRPDVVHHALGMLAGDLDEWTALARHSFHSGDSSNPVWRKAAKMSLDIDFAAHIATASIPYELAQVDKCLSL